MADLLAQQSKTITVSRGMEVEGEIVSILPQELILDIKSKAEGLLNKRGLSEEQLSKIKVGDKIRAFVLSTENESGQVVLGMQRAPLKSGVNSAKFAKFEEALRTKQVLTGKGLEVNKGGLIVEVFGVRGFLPISQVTLSQMGSPEEMVDKDIQVTVIEIDSNQNRLIFSQKVKINDQTRQKLTEIKPGKTVKGKIESILPFGLFIKIENELEGLVHISEVSWDKVDDLSALFKVGQEIEASIVSVDLDSGKLNLSLKQLSKDPFDEIAQKFQKDDVVKGIITKISNNGVAVSLKNPSGEGEIEGTIPTAKLDPETQYTAGTAITCIIDSIDLPKRRITLSPFIISTKDLIYK